MSKVSELFEKWKELNEDEKAEFESLLSESNLSPVGDLESKIVDLFYEHKLIDSEDGSKDFNIYEDEVEVIYISKNRVFAITEDGYDIPFDEVPDYLQNRIYEIVIETFEKE